MTLTRRPPRGGTDGVAARGTEARLPSGGPASAAERWPMGQDAATQAVLADWFAQRVHLAAEFGPHGVRLVERLRQSTTGGKGVRGRLVRFAHHHLGGIRDEQAARTAAAFELLHAALLLHDDVIDHDWVRRGVPNLGGVYRAEAAADGATDARAADRGVAAGIIAGDLALHGANRLLDSVEAPGRVRTALHDCFDRALLASAIGEAEDVDLTLGQGATDSEIVEVAYAKTAVYTFEAPLISGAILADADEAAHRALTAYGRHIGIVFQIRDDVLGVFGDGDETGKSTVSDLVERKQTLLLASARGTFAWPELQDLLDAPIDPGTADRIRRLLTDCGALESAERRAAWHLAQATEHLSDLPDGLVVELRAIASDAGERTR